ncbi:MAG: hypothetical protein ACN6RE_08955 [Stenotrophomonas sepilia]
MNSRNILNGLVALSVADGRLSVNRGRSVIAAAHAQWRPIAEAPQDGTRLMLWDSVSRRPVFGSWRGDNPRITHFAAEPAGPEVPS